MNKTLDLKLVDSFEKKLIEEEKSIHTIKKYRRDILKFYKFLPKDKCITKERMIGYKMYLKENYKIVSANSMLVAVNRFLEYICLGEYKVRQFKVPRVFFCRESRFMSKAEYERMVKAATEKKDIQLSLIMQTICSTGIRVGELQFIDVKALNAGYAYITNKGKSRIAFLPVALGKVLKSYCKSCGILKGPVFLNKNRQPVNRSVVWRKMKDLCRYAHVEKEKVFPHNLRHLFAFTFYNMKKDLLRLAEILGHASIETTRIYTASTGKEHMRLISDLGLVLSEYKSET